MCCWTQGEARCTLGLLHLFVADKAGAIDHLTLASEIYTQQLVSGGGYANTIVRISSEERRGRASRMYLLFCAQCFFSCAPNCCRERHVKIDPDQALADRFPPRWQPLHEMVTSDREAHHRTFSAFLSSAYNTARSMK